MSRPKLSSPDQPLAVRWVLRAYEFAASLSLAVILIFSSAAALGLATFVEAAWGTPVVQFYVYQSWWFELILILLAVNIFCAAAIRYPWKRYQTGFVITHIGLLTLLLGAAISRLNGIDAQVSVFEGTMSKWAVENSMDLRLSVARPGAERGRTEMERISVRFWPGLFNWDDWSQEFAFNRPEDAKISTGRTAWQLFRSGCGALFSLAWQHGPGDVLYDKDGIKLEVLDYYSDAIAVNAPHLELRIRMPSQTQTGADGKQKELPPAWVPVELSVLELPNQTEYPFGWANKAQTGGGYMTLQLAGSDAQTEAFLKCLPEGDLGKQGQAVLYAGGKLTRVAVDDRLGKGRFPLEGTQFEAEVTEFWPAAALADVGAKLEWQNDPQQTKPINPAVKIAVYRGETKLSELLLLALQSQSNVVDHKNEIYGEYWFDHSSFTPEERRQAEITARIDFLQGRDQKLYYRYWNREKVVFAQECPTDGSEENAVDAFTMPIGQLKMYVKEFIPSDKPAVVPVKAAFVKDRLIGERMQGGRTPAAKFRMTVDDKSEEFWLFVNTNLPDAPLENRPNRPAKLHMMAGKENRIASLTMPIEAIDVGFRVKLNKFERKLDPGTEQASHYSSWVDLVDRDADRGVSVLPIGKSKSRLHVWYDLVRPTAVAFDGKHGYVYWVESHRGAIRRAKWEEIEANPDEVRYESVIDRGILFPTALAIDEDAERIYFADRRMEEREERGALKAVNTDGEQLTTLVELEMPPEAIALDTKNKIVYFGSPAQGAIGRVRFNGEEAEPQWYPGPKPLGLAVDTERRHLLWSEAGSSAIRRVKFDGTGESLVVTRSGDKAQPLSLVMGADAKRLYFTESLANPPEDRYGRPVSKPEQWRVVSVGLDGAKDDERIECETNVDEPQSLTLDPDGNLVWTQTALLRNDLWITMNAPIDCFDPKSGRSYRLFQESFNGPFGPGERITSEATFDDLVAADSRKTDLYRSVLTVNYDPGRGIRNFGCLLVCLGIATMFYMRAYFFKPRQRVAPRSEKTEKITTPKSASPQPVQS